MLFLMGLLGMVAVGATVLNGNDDEEAPVTEGGDTPEADMAEMPADATALSELLDAAAPQDGSAATAGVGQGGGFQMDMTQPMPAESDGGAPDDATAWNIDRGGEGDDTIIGSVENDFLLGYGGDDMIRGGEGGDQIEGGVGDDMLFGQKGADTLHGEEGNDLLRGGRGGDDLFGHTGDDTLFGGRGADSLVGGEGEDSLAGGRGADALHGYHGDDTLEGGRGADTLFGGIGNDLLFGTGAEGADDGQQDYLNGGEGNDTIHAGASDVITGGEGADQIVFDTAGAGGGAIEVMDFEPGEDSLVLLHPADGTEPEVKIERDPENAELYRVLVDGEVAAELQSASPVSLADIMLVTQT
ncbi:MAG: calcium-binding protein [Roseovarius sp.]